MNIKTLYQQYKACNTISTDTRNINKNSLFFALKGDRFNGNEFAGEALDRGAKYCVVDDPDYVLDDRYILVKDVLNTLQQLATYHRRELNLPIIALTGSNGKTTTKELINAVLSKEYRTIATQGNLNNHIGVPLTLLQMDSTTEIGIVEMGANHPKEIELLCEIAEPDYGLITNFGKAHLEGFGSIEGVITAKSELYEYLMSHDKVIFINSQDPIQIRQTTPYMNVYKFGTETTSDTTLTLLHTQPYVTLRYHNAIINSQLTGSYNFNNIAIAIAIGSYFKIEDANIIAAIEAYLPKNNRSQILRKNSNTIIMDAYNANPTSMLAALENFKQLESERKQMFLGDMFELGTSADYEHQSIVEYLEKNDMTNAYLIGKYFYKTNVTHPDIKKFESFEDLKLNLQSDPIENSFILIKGSRGMALERILKFL